MIFIDNSTESQLRFPYRTRNWLFFSGAMCGYQNGYSSFLMLQAKNLFSDSSATPTNLPAKIGLSDTG